MIVVRLLWLVAVWLMLWSDLSIANTLSGVVVALAIVALFGTWHRGHVVIRPWHATKFVLYFLAKLVESSVVVVRAVLTPASRVYTGIVAVPLRVDTDAVVTLVADVISLTPGTLTLEVRRDPPTLYVHALDVRNVEAMQADVRRLEDLAVRAFGPAEAVQALRGDAPTGSPR